MPRGSKILGQPINEDKWERAKARAAEEGHSEDYAYIMDIYKKMTHLGEFQPKHIKERRKKKEKLPAWRERRWDVKRRQLQTAKSSIDRSPESGYTGDIGYRLILAKGSLVEFRCGSCKSLLFKGLHLQKSFIEVKCRSCGTFNVNVSLR